MGQKVHPEGLRVGYIHDWKSNWFNERNFADYLHEDTQIRRHIVGRLSHAGLSDITIRKNATEVEVNIHTARPGIVIGKSGSEVDQLRRDLHRITSKQVKVNILEIKRPELDANLVAQSIAEQLQNRVAFRRAMKRALTSAMRSGAKGVKVQVSGRLGGAEMARTEGYSDGRVPLHTLRADIDYGFYEARTTFGRIGVKCWINKGEIMPEGYSGADLTIMDEPSPQAPDRGGRDGRDGRDGRGRGAVVVAAVPVVAAVGPGGRGGGPGGRGGGPVAVAVAALVAAVAGPVVAAAVLVAAVAVPVVAAEAADRAAAAARATPEASADARAQARQVPKAASRSPRRPVARAGQGPVRRVRAEVARGRLAHQPADRGRPNRDDSQDQARRQGLDQRLSGQAVHEEARRDPDGLGQGQPRGLGRGRQARARDVRAGRRARAACA